MTDIFKYRSPVLRAELLGILADHGEDARVLAGGTDLLVYVRNGFARPKVVVDLKRVEGFSDVSWSQAEGLIIRPAVTINDILQHAKVRDSYPLLVACAQDLAS
ncbi:MAG: FAD binding domain-containing protein, partial [Acidimicrobiales bacterium]